ncbi:MAG: hypothetical protein GX879_02865 [Bacteroidales bacterium]|nr:hypothetical protein [Bacteroidales bacterium]
MKKILNSLLIISLSITFFSCSKDDSYSLDKFWVSPATVFTENVKPYLIVTDNGDRLFPSSSKIHYTPKNGQRVWVSYTILEDARDDFDYYVQINDISEILTKGIIELNSANKDSIGNDPVKIEDIWFTDNYLTIQFVYAGGGAIHFINLVRNEDALATEEGMPILEFRHNRNYDLYNNSIRGWVSFDLKSIEEEDKDFVVFLLKAKTFDDDKIFEKEVTYRYRGKE